MNVYYTRLTNVTYKVETYYETVEHAKDHSHSPEWKLVKEFSDVGTTGDTINKEGRFTPTLAGFNTPTTAGDETIKGDGTSVLRVYYTRTVSAAKARVEVYTETWQHAVDPTYSEDYVLAEDPTVYTGFIDEEIDLKAAFNDKYVALGYVWNDDNPDKAVLKVVNSANENTYKIYFDKDVASQGLDIVAHYETVASAVEHKKAVPAFARQFATQDDGQYEFGPVTKHLDKDAVNGLYIGRECSMVPGEGFIDTPDAELDKAGFFFDADFNSSDEAKALTDPATFPTYTIHLETDGEKNVAHVYYLRQTNISFTVHYKLETTKSYADTNDQETAEHKAEHWNDEAVSEDAVKGTNTHFYDDQKLSPYSGQFTYGYSFNLCDKTDWGFDIPGYTLRGFKNSSGDVIGNTITTDPLTEVLAPVDTDLSKNEYYIYYVKNANEEFTVKYNFETYEYASGQETDPDKRFKYDSTKDVKFHSYLGDVVDKDYYDTRTMDVLKQEFPGFTFIDDLMSPKELTLEYGQTEAERTINCYYSRDYYNPPESAGYTATYWANKIVDGVVKTDEFEYLGEKEFDAIFDEPVTVKPREAALLQKSVKGNEKLVEDFGEEYLFDHADYTADTTAESFKVDASHTQSVKVYYKPYLGPNPPSPQEAAFTVTYKGLSIEAAKAGGTHIREQYTEKLAEINFGA
ncbi:MAG: hypothetical protein Q4F54_00295 [Coriobacteriia bacterium]|nr:hypothetical protein [Coriobacteriia bacterium]